MAASAGLLLIALGTSGCASISQKFADVASQMPAIGLPANAPERPAETPSYPAVHDMPPPRDGVVLTGIEQQKLEDDLIQARDRQQQAAGIAPAKQQAAGIAPAKKKPPAKPHKESIAPSGQAIY
jgi:hypothetical protein